MTNSKTSSSWQPIATEAKDLYQLPREPTDVDVVRKACRDWFICFCIAMRPEWKAGKFYQVLADELQAAYEDVAYKNIDARLIVEAPPQHG